MLSSRNFPPLKAAENLPDLRRTAGMTPRIESYAPLAREVAKHFHSANAKCKFRNDSRGRSGAWERQRQRRYNPPMNLPAPARSRRLPQNKRRGFTLIEIAIAMVVIGVLLGAVVPTMRALEERRQFKNENSRMETIRDAIIGYAIRNRTRARTIEFVPYYFHDGGFALPSRVFHLPAGRPYLPCPDWDGDGYEDRLPVEHFAQGIEIRPNLAIIATVARAPRAFGNHPYLYLPSPISEQYGDCVVSRGGVPWRTLGVHPADHWGNRHTYYADQIFSNSVFGFDRQTIADIFNPRVPESPGHLRTPREATAAGESYTYHCPAVICNGIFAGNCWQHDFSSSGAQAIECTWGDIPPHTPNRPTPPYDMLVLKGGAATKEAWHNGGRKHFPPGSVTDGLPFVLVSHGPNGNYAVNHWATLRNPRDEDGNLTPVCNWRVSENSNIVSPDNRGRIHEAVNGSRIAPNHEFNSVLSRPPPPTPRDVRRWAGPTTASIVSTRPFLRGSRRATSLTICCYG